MTEAAPVIDLPLVRQLIDAQFPYWTDLPLHALEAEGTDERFLSGADNNYCGARLDPMSRRTIREILAAF